MSSPEDLLKKINKDRAVTTFIKLRGTEKYDENIPSPEVLNDLLNTSDKLRKLKGSKSFFFDLIMSAKNAKNAVGKEAQARCDEAIRISESIIQRIGENQLAAKEEVDEAHKFIDYILIELLK